MSRLHRTAVVLAAALAAAGPFARAASAEEVVLASGTRYEATKVDLLDGSVRFTYAVGGGSATVSLPFDRLEAHSLFGLVLARTPVGEAKAQLTLARFALDLGLVAEAQNRFRKAASMDPSLAPDRDAGLLAVKQVEAMKMLATAEADFRRARYALAAKGAKAALERAGAESPAGVKASGLLDLATKLEERDHARVAADAKAKADAQAAAEAAAFASALERADKTIFQAVDHRNRVANPDLSTSQAVHELEAADALLREGRRLLASARDLAGDHVDDVAKREHDALAIVVANHLDLADLYRQQGRFDKARDRARVALILDPQSTRATDIQNRIEQDLRNPPYVPTYADEGLTSYYSGPIYSAPYYRRAYSPYCGCSPRSYSGGFRFGFGGGGWRFTVGW